MALDCMIHVLGYYLKLVGSGQNNEENKTVLENLQKVMSQLLSPGRKTAPNPANDPIYDTIEDIIILIANHKLDFAIHSIVLDCMKSENLLSENVLIGLRAFMTIADKSDVQKVLSGEDKKPVPGKYPAWMVKLLERTHKRNNKGNLCKYKLLNSN